MAADPLSTANGSGAPRGRQTAAGKRKKTGPGSVAVNTTGTATKPKGTDSQAQAATNTANTLRNLAQAPATVPPRQVRGGGTGNRRVESKATTNAALALTGKTLEELLAAVKNLNKIQGPKGESKLAAALEALGTEDQVRDPENKTWNAIIEANAKKIFRDLLWKLDYRFVLSNPNADQGKDRTTRNLKGLIEDIKNKDLAKYLPKDADAEMQRKHEIKFTCRAWKQLMYSDLLKAFVNGGLIKRDRELAKDLTMIDSNDPDELVYKMRDFFSQIKNEFDEISRDIDQGKTNQIEKARLSLNRLADYEYLLETVLGVLTSHGVMHKDDHLKDTYYFSTEKEEAKEALKNLEKQYLVEEMDHEESGEKILHVVRDPDYPYDPQKGKFGSTLYLADFCPRRLLGVVIDALTEYFNLPEVTARSRIHRKGPSVKEVLDSFRQ